MVSKIHIYLIIINLNNPRYKIINLFTHIHTIIAPIYNTDKWMQGFDQCILAQLHHRVWLNLSIPPWNKHYLFKIFRMKYNTMPNYVIYALKTIKHWMKIPFTYNATSWRGSAWGGVWGDYQRHVPQATVLARTLYPVQRM